MTGGIRFRRSRKHADPSSRVTAAGFSGSCQQYTCSESPTDSDPDDPLLLRPSRPDSDRHSSTDLSSGPLHNPELGTLFGQPSRDTLSRYTTPPNSAPGTSSLQDTPMSHTSHGPEMNYKKVEDIRLQLKAELYNSVVDAGEEFSENAFLSKYSDEIVANFLKETQLYSCQRWIRIPPGDCTETTLYEPYTEIITAIFDYSNLSGTRKAVNTSRTSIPHGDDDSANLKSSPDIMILGLGKAVSPQQDNFPSKEHDETKLYPYCISPIEVKTDRNRRPYENMIQIALYCRQCFIDQHNRRFVYSMILTQNTAQILRFDRSGGMRSSLVDVHKFPETFIRYILGMASQEEQSLGYDTSIYWRNKEHRMLNFKNKSYTIEEMKPFFIRRAIRGRGTTCWLVADEDNRQLLVKDAWRTKGRQSEVDFLKVAKGLDGVGQMVDFNDHCETIWETRGLDIARDGSTKQPLFPNQSICDRCLVRIVLERYGKPISHFQSAAQLLVAFRDAVGGHWNLLKKRILHRDISINNILLGKEGATAGNRGVIIDMDLAVFLDRTGSLAGVDWRTGTRAFQAIMVLRSYKSKRILPPHDHMDDLESFFYVLCWICFGYRCPGSKKPVLPDFLASWENPDAQLAASAKESFFLTPIMREETLDEISPWFGTVFVNLLARLYAFFRPRIFDKLLQPTMPRPRWDVSAVTQDASSASQESDRQEESKQHSNEDALVPRYGEGKDESVMQQVFEQLLDRAATDYNQILQIIDQALDELAKQPHQTHTHTSSSIQAARQKPSTSSIRSSSSLKRSAEADVPESPPKKSKQSRHSKQVSGQSYTARIH